MPGPPCPIGDDLFYDFSTLAGSGVLLETFEHQSDIMKAVYKTLEKSDSAYWDYYSRKFQDQSQRKQQSRSQAPGLPADLGDPCP